jgi:hypothetical protein
LRYDAQGRTEELLAEDLEHNISVEELEMERIDFIGLCESLLSLNRL